VVTLSIKIITVSIVVVVALTSWSTTRGRTTLFSGKAKIQYTPGILLLQQPTTVHANSFEFSALDNK
jgi:hypothetical protein